LSRARYSMRFSLQLCVVAFASMLGSAPPAFAQDAGSGALTTLAQALVGPATAKDQLQDSIVKNKRVCRLWSMPSESKRFPQDASYSPCALDKAPVLISSSVMPGAPRVNRTVTGNFVIVVNADGTVNRELTRFGSGLLETEYLNAIQDSMSHWRFSPGMRAGIAVRSARNLRIESSGARVDTVTAGLDWTYRTSAENDTLSGRWVVRDPLPPLTAAQTDSMYMTFLYLLAAKRVMFANFFDGTRYCLVVQNGDSAAQARITNRARYMGVNGKGYDPGIDTPPPFYFAGYGCERTAEPLRIILPPIRRSEEGRVTFETGGDFLPNYPPGLDGRSWRSWRARCTGAIPERLPITLECGIDRGSPFRAFLGRYESEQLEKEHLAKRARPGGQDSTWITAIVTTRGAVQNDTLRATMSRIPMLANQLIDTTWSCGVFSAFVTARDTSAVWLINGNPFTPDTRIARVGRNPPSLQRPAPCTPQAKAAAATYRAFVASGIGGKTPAPITMLYTTAERAYVIDPARYTIVEQPPLKFRVSDLRPATRTGERLSIRLRIETAQTDVIPIVVFPDLGVPWLSRPTPVTADTWDFEAMSNHPANGTVYVYLIRRESPP
ncbi:MAG: hypothetical protein ABI852_15440, partial [Gemmatimonadaceae bacterium]